MNDPFANIFGLPKPKSKPKQVIAPNILDLFNGKGHPRPGDRITKPQRRAMKKDPWGDWDKDGVINGLDCQPKNPKKHGLNSLMRSRLESMNIKMTNFPTESQRFNTNYKYSRPLEYVDLKSQKGRIIQNTIKKAPNLLNKMESTYGSYHHNVSDKNIERDSPQKRTDPRPRIKFMNDSVKRDEYARYIPSSSDIELSSEFTELPAKERAKVLFHELKHNEQSSRIDRFENPKEFKKNYIREQKGKYYLSNKFEIEARNAEEQGFNEISKRKPEVETELIQKGMKIFEEDK